MAASVLAEYLADSPVLMWALDERTGTTFRDLNSNANHANQSSIASFAAGPILGWSAPVLNGSSSSANRDASVGPINGASLPFGEGARTMEVWAYPTFAPGATYGTLLAYGFDNGGGWTHSILQLAGGGVAGSAFTDGWNAGNNRAWTTDFTQNKWQHFVFTYAGGPGGACIFYRDTVADTTSTFTLNTTVSANRVRAGLRSDDARATLYFAGRLSLAAIYGTALSPTRIQAHYDAVRQASYVS